MKALSNGVLWQDVRYALRTLRQSPGYTLVGVLALALGIGANTAIFSVADAYLFKPVRLPDIERLAMILERRPQQVIDWNLVSPANYEDWKRQNRSFESLTAFQFADLNLGGAGTPEQVSGVLARKEFFEILGVRAEKGRTLLTEDEQAGHEQVVVLSHRLWERRFGSDPQVVGRTVRIDSKPYVVIGVMPKVFGFPVAAELWTPLVMGAKEQSLRTTHYLNVLGRLKDGVTVAQARAEMTIIAERLARTYPETNKAWGVRVLSIREFLIGDYTRQYTVLLMVAVGFVLLIACANVASLQFARASNRRKEIALRSALGASRLRVIRQLLTESILLSLFGAVGGILLGEWGLSLILSAMPTNIARFVWGWDRIQLDERAFLFTLAIAMLSGVVSGLAPAVRSSQPDLNEDLKEGSRGSSTGRSHQRLRQALLVGEIALALILLVGSSLMARGFRTLLRVNNESEPASLLTFVVNLPERRYQEPHQIDSFYTAALREFAAIPGVQSAALVSSLPFSEASTHNLGIEGRLRPASGELQLIQTQVVSANYLAMMHVPLFAGREFDSRDRPDSTLVAIIGAGIAQRYFADANPLGKRIRIDPTRPETPWLTIVGVVGDVRYDWGEKELTPAVYRPYEQAPEVSTAFAIRVPRGDPMRILSAVRTRFNALDAELPLFEPRTLDRLMYEQVVGLAYVAVMMTVLGVIALVLSSVGIYGAMSYAVTERTREIGIRLALGADRSDVLRMMVVRGMLITATGLAIGLPLAFLLARALASLIYGVSESDPITFGVVPLILAAVALLAAYIPSWRATKVDPVISLRSE